MTSPSVPIPKKPRTRYHHGDLRRALVSEAVRTIREEGVDALTLRAAGKRLGVSQTALYRHFPDKAALLAAVATEGFRMLRVTLDEAWSHGRGGIKAFHAMGVAYVRFARLNPSHYRVMFGGFVDDLIAEPELHTEASAAFQSLVDAIVAQQHLRVVRHEDPEQVARFVWAAVHGLAMLTIDGRFGKHDGPIDDLIDYAVTRIRTGIAAERATTARAPRR